MTCNYLVAEAQELRTGRDRGLLFLINWNGRATVVCRARHAAIFMAYQ